MTKHYRDTGIHGRIHTSFGFTKAEVLRQERILKKQPHISEKGRETILLWAARNALAKDLSYEESVQAALTLMEKGISADALA